jgi:hypothetical protein
MSSLQFLNKKSWHVNTRKNEEKVWLREQAAEKEAGRVAELQKQLTEERKLEEIRRLERESGNGSLSLPTPQVDWMYEGPGVADPSVTAAEQDALLLGQKEATLSTGQGERGVSPAGDLAKPSKLASRVVGPSHVDAPDPLVLRDAEAKLREDPLLSIRRQQVRATERLGVRRHVSGGEIAAAVKPSISPTIDAEADRVKLILAEKKARKMERARIREERRARRSISTGRNECRSDRIRNDARSLRRKTENDFAMASRVPAESLGTRSHETMNRCSPREHANEREFDRDSDKGVDDVRMHWPSGRVNCERELEMLPESSRVQLNLCTENRPDIGERQEVGSMETPIRAVVDRRSDRSTHRCTASFSAIRSNRMPVDRPPTCPRPPPMSADDRKRRLADMQTDAEALEESRATRIRRVEEEDLRSRGDRLRSAARGEDGLTPSFLHEFSREALNKIEASRFSRR